MKTLILIISLFTICTSVENKHQKQAVMLSYESMSIVDSAFPLDTSWSIVVVDVGKRVVTQDQLESMKEVAKLAGFRVLRLLYGDEIANVIVE